VHALIRQAVEVDVGIDDVRVVAEAFRLGQQVALFVDKRLAVPGHVVGRFAAAGRGVQVGREAARRLLAHELVPIPALAHHDVRGRQVDQHRGAGHRGERGRRNRHPDVFADLDVEAEQRQVFDLEQQRWAEGHDRAEQVDLVASCAIRDTELPGFVKLAIIRQETLGHHAQHPAIRDHGGAIEELVVDPQRQADHQRDGHGLGGFDDLRQAVEAGVEQRALVEQVVAAVGRYAQLGESHQHGALLGCLARQAQGLLDIEARVGDAATRDSHRDAGKVVRVEVEESLVHWRHYPIATEVILNYRTHIVSSLLEVGQARWDALVNAQHDPNPFLSYAFLHALHESGSAAPDTGWQPQYIVLFDGEELAAALPLYVKGHSYGEYERLCRHAEVV
jgi:hypothetical protein